MTRDEIMRGMKGKIVGKPNCTNHMCICVCKYMFNYV